MTGQRLLREAELPSPSADADADGAARAWQQTPTRVRAWLEDAALFDELWCVRHCEPAGAGDGVDSSTVEAQVAAELDDEARSCRSVEELLFSTFDPLDRSRRLYARVVPPSEPHNNSGAPATPLAGLPPAAHHGTPTLASVLASVREQQQQSDAARAAAPMFSVNLK